VIVRRLDPWLLGLVGALLLAGPLAPRTLGDHVPVTGGEKAAVARAEDKVLVLQSRVRRLRPGMTLPVVLRTLGMERAVPYLVCGTLHTQLTVYNVGRTHRLVVVYVRGLTNGESRVSRVTLERK
jgi:hypothetical protein